MNHTIATVITWGVNHWIIVFLLLAGSVLAGKLIHWVIHLIWIAFIIALIAVVVFHVPVKSIIHDAQNVTQTAQKIGDTAAFNAVKNEIKSAKYTQEKNGEYIIGAKDFQIIGHNNSPNATLVFDGKKLNINLSALGPAVNQEIQQLQANGQKK